MEQKSEVNAALWALPPEEVFRQLQSGEQGLSHAEAARRLLESGQNQVAEKEKRYGWRILVSQFKNPLIIVLIVAAVISFFLGEHIDAVVILAIVLLNSLFGFAQEYRAEKALRELSKFITIKSRVLRDGEITEIDSRHIVPGDIVYLDIGDIIPADIRLLHSDDMTTDESSLTGESLPVLKEVTTVSPAHSLPQYLCNVAFMGTTVASGLGHGVVIATGRNTFFGKTATLMQEEHHGDFHRNIGRFGNFLLKVTLAMTIFVFVANAFQGKQVFDSFLFAIALAVGITPEMLPVIITISLSNGALKMAKEKVIIKRLASVEDLGNMDILCCDKTGTLTEGMVSLQQAVGLDGKKNDRLVLYAMLCNSAKKGRHRKLFGNPIDRAVWESKEAAALEKEAAEFAVLDENEFDFERRIMSVLVHGKGGNRIIAKGAPDDILRACGSAAIGGKKAALNRRLLAKISKRVLSFEQRGYKVIAVAEKASRKSGIGKADEKELELQGLLLFLDPPKKTVKEALEKFEKLGVSIKIVSGDSPAITRKICEEVGLFIVEKRVVTGDELQLLDEKQLEDYSLRYNVFARVTPELKYRLVKALGNEGHVVGFLGDGVNDVPALKAADVGISVDSATGIAKEAAEIILLHKSLHVIADGITAGRKTFGNIMKYIMNTISANFGNRTTVAASSLFLPFIPLLPS
ncbi:MAG: magnesium-translocating P-type ATPase, partial [Candidatus Diapherotrites archaeon]|nr:magnesium-translocating P-type ATPase [Candidatus Diapherotrites archaeon]